MADYYSLCSEMLYCTKKQYDWLVEYVEKNSEKNVEYKSVLNCLDYEADPTPIYSGIWVHDIDGYVPEELFDSLQAMVKHFALPPIFIEIACTCSKPRINAFGGQLVMITADEIRSRGTADLRYEWEKEEVKRVTDNERTTV